MIKLKILGKPSLIIKFAWRFHRVLKKGFGKQNLYQHDPTTRMCNSSVLSSSKYHFSSYCTSQTYVVNWISPKLLTVFLTT